MCNTKTMIKIFLGIALLLIAGYFAFPHLQIPIATLAPYFLVLSCPLAMYLGMKGMHRDQKQSENHHRMHGRFQK